MGWGSGDWGVCSWGVCDDEPTTPDPINVGITQVNIFARDLIEVVFGTNVKNTKTITDPSNWTLPPVNVGQGVTVLSVLTSGLNSIDRVYLVVTPFTAGAYYVVTMSGEVRSIKNEQLIGSLNKTMKGRRTKVDSLCSTRPSMYDLRPKAIYRNILNAIGVEDDKIGGSQNEGEDIIR